MIRSTKFFRVRFCEWQTFAIDIPADSSANAIAMAQALRDTHGTLPFEEITGGSDDWEADEQHPCETALRVLKGALAALQAPAGTDTQSVTADVQRLICDIEGGVA